MVITQRKAAILVVSTSLVVVGEEKKSCFALACFLISGHMCSGLMLLSGSDYVWSLSHIFMVVHRLLTFSLHVLHVASFVAFPHMVKTFYDGLLYTCLLLVCNHHVKLNSRKPEFRYTWGKNRSFLIVSRLISAILGTGIHRNLLLLCVYHLWC